MKTAARNSETTTASGTKISVNVTASRGYGRKSENVWIDQAVNINPEQVIEETEVTTTINGKIYKDTPCTIIPDQLKRQGAHAVLGYTLPIGKAIYDIIMGTVNEAIAEAETDADWMQYIERMKENDAEVAEYEAHSKRVDNMMTLNGKSC